jgi:hypothetical protein
MMIDIDHTEVMTLLENNSNICNACLLVTQRAVAGDLESAMENMTRCTELIMQSIKSNTAILHNVQQRWSAKPLT